MTLNKKEEKAVRNLKRHLTQNYSLVDFRVFGSKARGDAVRDSDIDVMIEIEGLNPVMESDILDIVFDINLENDCFISALMFSKEEIEKGPLSQSPIYKNIMEEGVFI